jgi:hypothetical protein
MDSAMIDGKNISDRGEVDANELPLNHLHPCVLSENGVPPGRSMHKDSNGESGMFIANAILEDHLSTGSHTYPEPAMAVEFTDNEGNEMY